MILYVLCYCCKKKNKSQSQTKEYRPNERASLVNGAPLSKSGSRTIVGTHRSPYETIDGQNYLVRSPPNGGQPSLYQNVTQAVRADSSPQRPAGAPPAYEQLA